MLYALIPAAGIGKRLRPFTFAKPKPLLEVAGKPILFHILDILSSFPFTKKILIVNYLKEILQQSILDAYPQEKEKWMFIEQKETLGLGHAVYIGIKDLPDEGSLFIVLGDTIFFASLEEVFSSFIPLISLQKVSDPSRFGVARIEEKEKRILEIIEKPKNPPSPYAFTGIAYFPQIKPLKEALEHIIKNHIQTHNEYQLTDAISYLIQEKKEKVGYFFLEEWIDCGTKEALLEANQKLLQKEKKESFIGENTILNKTKILPYSSIGKGCKIENSIIENSIIEDNVNIKDSYIKNSIIGERSTIKSFSGSLFLAPYSYLEVKG